jgi:hypothetical protein
MNNLNKFNLNTLDDLKKYKDLSNHKLFEKIKTSAAAILIFIMWTVSIAFTFYIIWFLYLTAFTTSDTTITRMQDIIVKISGWVLFILSQAGFIKRNNKSEER